MKKIEDIYLKGLIKAENPICNVAYICKNGKDCSDIYCSECELEHDIEMIMQIILEDSEEENHDINNSK